MKDEMKLKLCPFCGSDTILRFTPTLVIIECQLCPCSMRYKGSASVLATMWNTRDKVTI